MLELQYILGIPKDHVLHDLPGLWKVYVVYKPRHEFHITWTSNLLLFFITLLRWLTTACCFLLYACLASSEGKGEGILYMVPSQCYLCQCQTLELAMSCSSPVLEICGHYISQIITVTFPKYYSIEQISSDRSDFYYLRKTPVASPITWLHYTHT